MQNLPEIYPLATLGLIALLFGIGYNYGVGYLSRQGYLEGYTSFVVAGGNAFVLVLLIPLIGFECFLIALGLFIAAGLPMIVGSAARHAGPRREELERDVNVR